MLEFILSYFSVKQDNGISTLNGKPLKLVDQFSYLGSNISSSKSGDNLCIEKA